MFVLQQLWAGQRLQHVKTVPNAIFKQENVTQSLKVHGHFCTLVMYTKLPSLNNAAFPVLYHNISIAIMYCCLCLYKDSSPDLAISL